MRARLSSRLLPCLISAWTYLAIGLLSQPMARAAEPAPVAAVSPEHAAEMVAGLELFRGSVSELLKTHCVKCHGGQKTESDFDLTTREGLLKGGAQGLVAIAGKSQESVLLQLIRHEEEPHMPEKSPKLADAAIASIAKWIDLGAPYDGSLVVKAASPKGKPNVTVEDRQFWSFQPLTHPQPPEVAHADWCATPVDRFVLAKLEAQGLTANGPVDRRRLIRRAYFDLLGLPPTPGEIDQFVNDPAADAYPKLIDRLLESPHYGERWGRHWLDLARFAESHGYEQDYDRPTAYHYRDFVIRALNEDMPYNRFVRLQLAGDELEPDNPQAMMATGYLAAGTHATQITANQVEKERYDELDDMTATIGTSLLGLTIGCARCHDHKFDPIPTTDYYRLLATFTTTVRSEVELNLQPEKYRQQKEEFDRQHDPLVVALNKFEREELPSRLAAWLATNPQPSDLSEWAVLEADSLTSAGGASFARQADGSYLATGKNADVDTYTFEAHTELAGITAVRLDALADPSMVKGGPGRAGNGNFALTDFAISMTAPDGNVVKNRWPITGAAATFEQGGLPVAATIDNDPKSAWAVDPQFGKDHTAVFQLASPLQPLGTPKAKKLTFTLKFENNTGHNIGRLRIALTTAPAASLSGNLGPIRLAEIHSILQTPTAERTPDQQAALLLAYRTIDPEWQKLNAAVVEHAKQEPKPELTKALVSTEGLPAIRLHTQGADFFEKTYMLKRGDLNQKQAEASQSFLQVLMRDGQTEKNWIAQPPTGSRTSYRRTSLANWITDVDHGAGHLLARVIVNRLWQHHIGRGIVATPSDFGSPGERPTHPELLDYLASDLVRDAWRLKPLHKLIMTSSVYMQSCDDNPAAAKLDPDNTLLWRRSRRRLEGEAIRDAMLAVSGTLDERMFGPGSLDEAQKRRSIYFTIKRSQLVPIMMLFDGPDSLQSLGIRSSTTIAPQALALMNNPQVLGYARALARRLLPAAEKSPADAVRSGTLIALGRVPAAEELSDALAFLEQQSASYRTAGKTDALELALSDYCRALMSLNEFMYIE